MNFKQTREEFNDKLKKLKTAADFEELRLKYLGKKGTIALAMKNLQSVENKKEMGQEINKLKEEIIQKMSDFKNKLDLEQRDLKLKQSEIDVTLDTPSNLGGRKNILLQTKEDIEKVFQNMGYEVALGQEVESDFYNFEALNLGEDHPARDMQDTFYINPKELLRTHTSNIQSRVMSSNPNKELKIICPGKVYRRDDDDATHSHQFMQIEGLVVVNKNSEYTASLKDLKTTLTIFVRQIFNNEQLKVRLRPSFFPFTEPSVEVDVNCSKCLGQGCSFCKQTGWIEILGAGIINPAVLSKNGFDSEEFTGFAFGIGVERITLLKYNIDDIRTIYQNNNEFIKQF